MVLNHIVPRYLRVDAWSLLTFCVDNLDTKKIYLDSCMALCLEMERIQDTPRVQIAIERTGRMLRDVERSRTTQQPTVVEVLPEDDTLHGVPSEMLVQRFTMSLHGDEEVQVSSKYCREICINGGAKMGQRH